MTSTNNSSNRSRIDKKKAVVMHTDKTKPAVLIVAAVAAIALVIGLSLLLFSGGRSSVATQADQAAAAPVAEDGRIAYAVSLFDDGNARHFKYADAESKTTIAYFILKSTDGVIRAAFDACDVCWRAGKGYYQEGSTMVCRNCGRRFESVLVNEVQGGCNPAPLNRAIEGDRVVIRVEDLKAGHRYFNFS